MKLCKCRLHNLENESEETAMERRKLTKEDIDKVRDAADLKRIKLISADGQADLMRPVLNAMDEETFKLLPARILSSRILSRSMAFRMMRQQTIITENRLQRM